MALTWRRTRTQLPPLAPRPPEPDRSVADVVHQLEDLSTRLRLTVDRLEHAADTIEQTGPDR